ncbi:MAG: hypothetical protein H6709_08910 [Kofleriaceae bacterium]|nr:hypothetical protein [Myxococcales bacterium]MCB9565161.1 hypothetical protein [Kofleriaceae bacterium]MCB9572190.1 hypothetical protein [Kofleriaceae bacterium]
MRSPLLYVKLARSFVRLVRDPDRLDEVFVIADGLQGTEAVDAMIDHARRDPQGSRALDDRPRVAIDLPRLRAMPDGTLGRETARFLDDRGLDPTDIPQRDATDPASFVRAHLYETHDLWHVVTGFHTDVAGEIGLQAFYLAQLPARLAPMLISIAMLNTFLMSFDDRDARMEAITRGWQLGRAAQQLFGLRWAELWSTPLVEVRARLGLPPGGVGDGVGPSTTARAAA